VVRRLIESWRVKAGLERDRLKMDYEKIVT
jgi:hypothetical protein